MQWYIQPTMCFRIIRFIGQILGSWPVTKSHKYFILNMDFMWAFYLSNYIFMFVPSLRGFIKHRKNLTVASYALIELTAITEAALVLIISKYFESTMKTLLGIAEYQLSLETPKIVKRYVNFYTILYILMVSLSLVVSSLFMRKPAASDQEFIMTAFYPFEVESQILKFLLLCNQIFVLTHTAILANLDAIAILLMLSCTHRLKSLELNFEGAIEFEQLRICIFEHEKALSLVQETNTLVRIIVIKTVISYMLYTFGCGLQVLNSSNSSQWTHQIVILSLVYVRIFLCAEAAQNMTSAGEDIESAVYFTGWYNERSNIMRTKTIMIHRCQKLPIISVSGLMSALDRRYLGMILYSTLSYLMTLRTVTGSK